MTKTRDAVNVDKRPPVGAALPSLIIRVYEEHLAMLHGFAAVDGPGQT
jgi:hypothetical protein